jgi:hypothetical protein
MYAGVGHDDIEPTEVGDSGINGRGQGIEIRDIRQARHATPTALLHLCCGIAQLVGRRRGVQCDHIGAFVGEALAMGTARAPRRTGDHDHLVAQSGHQGALIRSNPVYPASATSVQMSV